VRDLPLALTFYIRQGSYLIGDTFLMSL